MEAPKLLELTFIPALDDYPLRSHEYQKGLRSFTDSLEAEGRVSVEAKLLDTSSNVRKPATYSGVFNLDAVSVELNRCVTAWLNERFGRQVRVGIGPRGQRPTAEAQTGEELDPLLAKAGEYIEIMREIRGSTKDTEDETLQIDLRLFPGPNDQPLGDDHAYQSELERFEQSLNSQGLEVSRLIELRESAEGGPTASSFLITFASNITTVLVAALGGWLHGRNGRKVRLKFGSTGQLEEVEVSTPKQLKEVMEIAEEYVQRHRPTVIR